jgi:hypothetical protein
VHYTTVEPTKELNWVWASALLTMQIYRSMELHEADQLNMSHVLM